MDAGALTLRFSPAGLGEIVGLFNRQRASGCLRIHAGEDRGALALQQGQITAAFFNHLSGPQALSRLMVSGPGVLSVDPIAPVYDPNVAGDTATILARIDRVLSEVHFDRVFGDQDAAAVPALPGAVSPPTSTRVATSIATRALTAEDLDAALGAQPLTVDDPEMTMRTVLLPPQVGSLLGRCLLKKQLGQGASSVVYLAHHTALDVDVVVKVLMPGTAGPDASALTHNEARILARLNHPSILRVFDYDETDRFPHLVMEYVNGGSLHDAIHKHGAQAPDRLLSVLRQVAKALAYGHAQVGLVHGDIKPSNILLGDGLRAKLIDFGIASLANQADTQGTSVRRMVRGTPSYLAPELLQRPFAMGWTSDCYALGCTAYHALVGRPPYHHEDPMQLMLLHSTAGYVPLSVARPELPAGLIAIVERCMALRAEERFARAGELVAALEALGDDRDEVGGIASQRRTTMWQHLANVLRRA